MTLKERTAALLPWFMIGAMIGLPAAEVFLRLHELGARVSALEEEVARLKESGKCPSP